jgi:phospholipid-transporting ATPase
MFMMYKNFAMIAVYFWSSIDALGSPVQYYDEFLLSFFNLLFTLLLPFAYGLWERDLTKRDLLSWPPLYKPAWNPMVFPFPFTYFALAFWQGIVVYFIVRFAMPEEALEACGNLAYICIVIMVTIQFLVWSCDWNWLTFTASVLTMVLLFGVLLVYAYFITPSLMGVITEVIGSWKGWLLIVMTVAAGVLPYILVKTFYDLGWPTLKRLVQEKEGVHPGTPTGIDGEEELGFWKLTKEAAEEQEDADSFDISESL